MENLVLLAGALAGTGNGLGNLLTGNDVDNTLDGGVGVDTLIGGKGNDSFFVDDAKDVVTEAAGAGNDTVTSTAATYTLGANVENLVLDTGAIGGTGNTLNNTLTGNGDDNTLDGKAGKDHMIGGAGNDTYVVDNVGDVVDEAGAAGIDTVNSSISFSLANGATVLGALENLTLTGAGGISGTGNELANNIIGNAGANTLFGGGENDTIDGGGGNDIVTGGAGDDHIDVAHRQRYRASTPVRSTAHDVIDNFDGNPTGGQDVLNLDALFDSLGSGRQPGGPCQPCRQRRPASMFTWTPTASRHGFELSSSPRSTWPIRPISPSARTSWWQLNGRLPPGQCDIKVNR